MGRYGRIHKLVTHELRIMLHCGYSYIPCLSIEKTKTKEIKTERGETLKKNCFPVDPTTLTLRRKTDITRAPSTACWLFSRHIAVVSGKSPHYFSGSRSSEAVGIAHSLVACSARIAVDRHTHTHTRSTGTLAAHARRGLTIGRDAVCACVSR